MKELAEEEPHLVEQFQKLSEAAGKVGIHVVLKETLTGLAKNADELQNSSLSEEELSRAMEGLGMDEVEGEGNILPFMQNIMQNLLSKEVLYPSLKEITDKFPEWLQTHQDTLPAEEYRKYQEQHSLMARICRHFETEQSGDEAARFEAIMDLMQQELGHPPKELGRRLAAWFEYGSGPHEPESWQWRAVQDHVTNHHSPSGCGTWKVGLDQPLLMPKLNILTSLEIALRQASGI
ncbi:unnamed protein product, partial [Ranitomeya imitator]